MSLASVACAQPADNVIIRYPADGLGTFTVRLEDSFLGDNCTYGVSINVPITTDGAEVVDPRSLVSFGTLEVRSGQPTNIIWHWRPDVDRISRDLIAFEVRLADNVSSGSFTVGTDDFYGLAGFECISAQDGITQRIGGSYGMRGPPPMTWAASRLLGDFDRNRILDARDIDALSAEIVVGSHSAQFDLTGDRLVNAEDGTHWVEVLKRTRFGDANLDGEVTAADFFILSHHFRETAGWASGNFNSDFVVDFADFVLLAKNFNAGRFEVVPEPKSGLLVGSAVVLVAWGVCISRRRRAA